MLQAMFSYHGSVTPNNFILFQSLDFIFELQKYNEWHEFEPLFVFYYLILCNTKRLVSSRIVKNLVDVVGQFCIILVSPVRITSVSPAHLFTPLYSFTKCWVITHPGGCLFHTRVKSLVTGLHVHQPTPSLYLKFNSPQASWVACYQLVFDSLCII